MVAPQQRGRRRATIGVIVLAAATLITLDFQNFGPLGAVQSGARAVLTPIEVGAERLMSPVTNAWSGATGYDDLTAENDELRAQVDELRGELARSGIDREDYEALLAVNGLQSEFDLPLLLARVRPGEIGNFSAGIVEIERGSSDGVEPDMAVVTPAGVVGRVEQVDRNSSTVRLVSSSEFVMGAEVAGEVGLARGTGSTTTLEIQQGISDRALIEEGDVVTTTSSERTLFPPNLVIGNVLSISQNEDASNQQLVVELAANPTDLHFVSIVLVEPGLDDAADAEDALDREPVEAQG